MTSTSPVSVGYELPPFERTTGFGNWNRFAAVNYEFVDIHMDDEAGRAAGFDSAFGMGNLLWSYMHCLLDDWIDDRGRIEKLQCQFRRPNLKGMHLVARGVVTAVRDSDTGQSVDLDIWIEDADGTKLTPGTATVSLSR
ncbi:MaoC/PaaZ C-terminal domain-containing protein [Rhodococcus sp. P1Y]|uniref:MaoC/PaaZ C-terminal domain-containing protein n=1 Tax=Rhodococcus sp. P1Y TaxID=1302308 RepID=UPI000EB0D02B|nr:MaoC/PaaZ C-terminal domain-containing protein [Rhodococcus sp. P1Y]AYJ50331.1 hypothetical protein D8W71_20900 [Rhodococcus sp. P1Y]